MSATYEAAAATLSDAADLATSTSADHYPAMLATLGTGRALLACAEELEALVELLRERLPAAAPVDYGPEEYPTALDVVDGPACVTCGVRRDLHDAERAGHAWNGGGSA